MRPRVQANGDLIFPMQGQPPADNIPNYERDTKDPYLFHMLLDPCKYRINKVTIQSCGRSRCLMWCNLLNKEVSAFYCDSCNLREAG